MPDRTHVMPRGDLVAHEADEDCICGPDAEFVEGGIVFTHHSLDGREDSEADDV